MRTIAYDTMVVYILVCCSVKVTTPYNTYEVSATQVTTGVCGRRTTNDGETHAYQSWMIGVVWSMSVP